MQMPPTGRLWDASGLLCLVATRRAEEILGAAPLPSFVCREVRVGEVLYVRSLPEDDPPGALVPVDTQPLLTAGILNDIELTSPEITRFIELAAQIDDGEAMTIAVAASRNLVVVTDDRRAIRVAQALDPPLAVETTPEWVKSWADANSVPDEELRQVLRRIRLGARYRPRPAHPLYDWWNTHQREDA